jgi:Fic family protein
MTTTQIETTIKEYNALDLSSILNYEKYKLYSIVTGSTALEGSTLTALDTQLLLDEGITAKGKPIEHHLMVQDNYNAMKEVLRLADLKTPITKDVLITINGLNMKNTGQIVNSALGTVDGTTGAFRKVQVHSEALGYYLAPTKVPAAMDEFCKELQQQMLQDLSPAEALTLSFTTQAKLIIIHPWQDGNKRTSRLVSNYIQRYFGLPLGKVEKEDSSEYLLCLKEFKYEENIEPFCTFMQTKYVEMLKKEIQNFKQGQEWDLHQNVTAKQKL